MLILKRIIATVSLFLSPLSYSVRTPFITMEHPQGWQCEVSQKIYLCQSTLASDRKESILLIITTEASSWDNLDNYLEYLKKPRPLITEKGKKIKPDIIYVRKRSYNGKEWVDSLQKNSELPNFFTRYVATTTLVGTKRYAILITYLISEKRYKKLAPIFERMLATLKINPQIEIEVASKQSSDFLSPNKVGKVTSEIIRERLKNPATQPVSPSQKQQDDNTMLYLGIAFIFLIFIVLRIIRKRRKR